MKTALAILAAGVLSASATIVHAQQALAPAGATPGQIRPAPQPQGMQVGGVALPKLPANLQDPNAATKASADIFAFMQLMQQQARVMREQAVQQRNQVRASQIAAMQQAAEKVKQAAAAALQQASVNSQFQVAAGAAQLGQGQARPGIGQQANLAPQSLTPQQQQAVAAIMNAQKVFTANLAAADAEKKKAAVAVPVSQPPAQSGPPSMTEAQKAQMAQMDLLIQEQMRRLMETTNAIQQMLQQIVAAQNAASERLVRARFAQ